MEELRKLKILIKMQLRSAIDFSFLKSKRAFILKVGLALVAFAAITAAFYAVFYICVLLSVFSFGGGIPETVVTVLFTLIQLMSIFSCMTGLSKTLYRGGDNVILLVLPTQQNTVFLSKLLVYYFFELKRSFTLTVPMYLAYGLVNGAVWFYYPWMLFGFLFVSLLPVAIGAVLSILALYIPKLLSRVPLLKYLLIVAAAGGMTALAFYLVGLIPENINLLGQWGSISLGIRNFLNSFARWFAPYHYLNLMLVGGALEITRNPLSLRTLYVFLANLGVIAVFIAIAFFTARVLFLKLTAKAGENELRSRKQRPNRVRGKLRSALSEDLLRNVRSGKAVWRSVVEFFVPAFLLFALNRIYAAMNTSLAGQAMTATFNVLVLLVTVLTSNTFLANVYSRDGAARNLLKTRPIDMRLLLAARLVLRAVLSTLSIGVAVTLFHFVSGAVVKESVGFFLMATFVNLAHILWSAEIDVMNPEARRGGNEAQATAFAILLAVFFTAGYFLFSDRGAATAFIELALVAAGFLVLRVFLYFERVRVYFVEK